MNDIDIKEIRVNLGVSQEKLAEMVGVSPRTVQNWESGSKIPNSKHAILRSLLLKDTPQYAGGGEEIKKAGNLIPFYDNVASIGGVNELGADMGDVTQPSAINIENQCFTKQAPKKEPVLVLLGAFSCLLARRYEQKVFLFRPQNKSSRYADIGRYSIAVISNSSPYNYRPTRSL